MDFFTLSYTLRAMDECIEYLLDVKKVTCVLPGKLNNDPIEMCFCLMRSMPGADMALNVKYF